MQPDTLTRPQLTLADRCDRCGAAAKVRAVLPKGGELLFCGHHAKAHADKLREMQADVQTGPLTARNDSTPRAGTPTGVARPRRVRGPSGP